MNKYTECPECGTEILAPDECGYCQGNKVFYDDETGDYLGECQECQGDGFSKNYHCPHCDWTHEE